MHYFSDFCMKVARHYYLRFHKSASANSRCAGLESHYLSELALKGRWHHWLLDAMLANLIPTCRWHAWMVMTKRRISFCYFGHSETYVPFSIRAQQRPLAKFKPINIALDILALQAPSGNSKST